MKLLNTLVLLLLVLLPVQQAAASDVLRPVLIYNAGEDKNDKAFIEAALEGAKRAKQELGVAYKDFNIFDQADAEGAYRRILEAENANLVIAIGFQNVSPIMKFAAEYPNVHFTLIDGMVPPLFSNVQSVIFKDQEGAFLVGMIAALTSKTGMVGFIGGMDVPLMRNFAYGYLQGAKYAVPNAKVLQTMLGTTPEAWRSPTKAANVATQQFTDGADIIFAAAGGSAIGALEAAKKEGKLAIGVDTNQNGLFPGTVLTSMVKRVDRAVFKALQNAQSGAWEPGIKYLGLRNDAFDYALDDHNRKLLAEGVIAKVEKAKALIVRGELEVDNYTPR